jgi:uncharacterized protein (DUF3084 family)
MELTFSNNYVYNNSFYEYQKKYLHRKYTINQQIQDREQQIQNKEQQIQNKEQQIQEKEQQIQEKEQQIQEKEQQIQEKEQRIKDQNQDLGKYDLLKDEYTRMYLSVSWRMTRFLRKLQRLTK